MKKLVLLLVACLCAVSVGLKARIPCGILSWRPILRTSAAVAEEPAEVLYFHRTICENCQPEEDFAAEFQALTGRSLSDYRFSAYNVLHEAGRRKLDETAAEYGLTDPPLPMVVLDGRVYMGSERISAALPEDFLGSGGGTDSMVYYLYTPACESCARVDAVLSALPDSVDITRGAYSFSSQVMVRKLDVSRDPGAALALFDRYAVPDTDRVAPIVFLSDRYFAGADKIAQFLPAAVRSGYAVGNEATEAVGGDTPLPALTLIGTALAGLAGGLNPCALSMLLLFLSLLVGANRPAGRHAAAFLGGKFAAYLLIGTVLLGVFQTFNPVWLPLAIKVALTALCAVFIVLNLSDAVAARRARYGDVKNQLPKGMRRFLHARIEAAFAHGRGLMIGAAGLGVVVAGGEFLCAGQVYVATLLASLRSGIASLQAFGLLIVYCAAFLVPSGVLCALVLRGRAAMTTSQWVLARMPLIKVLTAVAMAAILVWTWA